MDHKNYDDVVREIIERIVNAHQLFLKFPELFIHVLKYTKITYYFH